MSADPGPALEAARERERAQAAFYRALAVLAEEAGEADTSQRLNELHADEQHQLSRLTARLLEIGSVPADLAEPDETDIEQGLAGWQQRARLREREEVRLYEALLRRVSDPPTQAMFEEFLRVERLHEGQLGGKWMGA
ncbi:MAG: hypothetical protein ACRELD_00785 [Longimicrobiales bacterium]